MAPASAGRRRRRILWTIIAIVSIAAVYAIVIALYARSGQVAEAEIQPRDTSDGVVLHIEPQAVHAATGRISLDIDLVQLHGSVSDDEITLTETVNVVVSGAAGPRTISFEAGSYPSPVSVDLVADGVIEQWPFDVHTSVTTLIAYYVVDDVPEALKTYVVADGRVPGWNIAINAVGLARASPAEPPAVITITATRSGSTIAFGAVLLGLMIVMPVLVLAVAISVYRGRRRVEASFMSWMGAMLFATIPLRTFLPGSPPIGSWIDFLIVLWVIVGLIAGLAIYVAAWFRWSPPRDSQSA